MMKMPSKLAFGPPRTLRRIAELGQQRNVCKFCRSARKRTVGNPPTFSSKARFA